MKFLAVVTARSIYQYSSLCLYSGLGFSAFFLIYFLLTAPAPLLILFLYVLTVLDFDNVFEADAIFEVDSPSEE